MSYRLMTCWLQAALALGIALSVCLISRQASADSSESRKIFTQRCMACHTFGKGTKIGPDLKGITERRERPWLLKFIRSSQSMIAAGDPIATALFQQYKQQQMPDWLDLSEAQIGDLLDWLAANGPDAQEGDSRSAATATIAEIERGRRLFHGEQALALGGVACDGCHALADRDGRTGGSLGPALSTIYSSYQDGALTQILKRPCVTRLPESSAPEFLLPEETFALKAYLRHVAALAAPVQASTPAAGRGQETSPMVAGGTQPKDRLPRWQPRERSIDQPRDPSADRRAAASREWMFRELPYCAFAIFFLGLLARTALARRTAEAAPRGQDDPLRTRAVQVWRAFWSPLTFRVGLAATALAHLVGILAPRLVAAWAAAPWRLYLLEGSGFLFGALALIGWTPILWRHLRRSEATRAEKLRGLADSLALGLLGVALITGLATAALHRWGALWAAATLTPYLESLASGAPASGLVEQLPPLVRAHVVSWIGLVAVFPACSAAAIAVYGLDRLLAATGRALDRAVVVANRARARLSPARWIWPDEEPVAELAAEDENLQEQH